MDCTKMQSLSNITKKCEFSNNCGKKCCFKGLLNKCKFCYQVKKSWKKLNLASIAKKFKFHKILQKKKKIFFQRTEKKKISHNLSNLAKNMNFIERFQGEKTLIFIKGLEGKPKFY